MMKRCQMIDILSTLVMVVGLFAFTVSDFVAGQNGAGRRIVWLLVFVVTVLVPLSDREERAYQIWSAREIRVLRRERFGKWGALVSWLPHCLIWASGALALLGRKRQELLPLVIVLLAAGVVFTAVQVIWERRALKKRAAAQPVSAEEVLAEAEDVSRSRLLFSPLLACAVLAVTYYVGYARTEIAVYPAPDSPHEAVVCQLGHPLGERVKYRLEMRDSTGARVDDRQDQIRLGGPLTPENIEVEWIESGASITIRGYGENPPYSISWVGFTPR